MEIGLLLLRVVLGALLAKTLLWHFKPKDDDIE